jgi:predicted metal-binding protein
MVATRKPTAAVARRLGRYVTRARELGADDARLIGPRDVVCSEWVRLKCQYGCDGNGACLTCPPLSPTPEQTRRILDEYAHLLLVHYTRRGSVTRLVIKLEREIFLDDHPKAFAWAAGPCGLCRTCDTSAPCKHADRAPPSMEACGIDVFSTARRAGFPIRVVCQERDDQNYFGLIGIECGPRDQSDNARPSFTIFFFTRRRCSRRDPAPRRSGPAP